MSDTWIFLFQQTVRPRPTGKSTTSQVLPPPPNKKTVRATSLQQQQQQIAPFISPAIPPPLTLDSRIKETFPINSNVEEGWKDGTIGLVSHAKTTMDIQAGSSRPSTRSRSRTSGSQKVPDIMTSIMKASKSLEGNIDYFLYLKEYFITSPDLTLLLFLDISYCTPLDAFKHLKNNTLSNEMNKNIMIKFSHIGIY